MRTLVIGDTHGCLDELLTLLEIAAIDLSRERLILLGDYIDRGPKSYQLLQYLQKLQTTYGSENVVLLRGNHEQMAIDYLQHHKSGWSYNGGHETMYSFAKHKADIVEIHDFLNSMPLYFTDDYYIYVHAGLKPGVALEEQRPDDLLWIREEFYRSAYDFGKTVVFGHTPTVNINGRYRYAMLHNKIALDTACVFGGCLSALELQGDSITQVYMVTSGKNCRCPEIA